MLRGRSTYDFIGLEQYFACDKTLPDVNSFPKKLCHTIVWSDRFLESNGISSYDSLARHIQSIVSRESTSGSPLLLVFDRQYPMQVLKKILSTIPEPEPADALNLRAIYFQQRKKQPQRSGFARGRLKILAHLRLGDRAAVHMPWGLWIYRSGAPLRWKQSHRERDCPGLTVADFYQFMRGLLGHFPPDTIDAQIYSDGFGRTMKMLGGRKREMARQSDPLVSRSRLCLAERRLLRQDLKYQGRLLRQLLKGLPNSTCFIGEKKSQLFSLIHAAVEADLVITAFPLQHTLITQLMRFYTTQEIQPTFLLLHKPDVMSGNDVWVELKSKLLANFSAQGMFGIFVDISAPDFSALTQQILNQHRPVGAVSRD